MNELEMPLEESKGIAFFGSAAGGDMIGAGVLAERDVNLLAQLDFRPRGALGSVALAVGEQIWFYLAQPGLETDPPGAAPKTLLILGEVCFAKDEGGRDGFLGCAVAVDASFVDRNGCHLPLAVADGLLAKACATESYRSAFQFNFQELEGLLPTLPAAPACLAGPWPGNPMLVEVGLPQGWFRQITPAMAMVLLEHFQEKLPDPIRRGYILREVTQPPQNWQFGPDFIEAWYKEVVAKPRNAIRQSHAELGRVQTELESSRSSLRDLRLEVEQSRQKLQNIDFVVGKVEKALSVGNADVLISKSNRIDDLVEALGSLEQELRETKTKLETAINERERLVNHIKSALEPGTPAA